MTAQMELFAWTPLAPAPARECGELTAQDDGHGYEPPARRASIESSALHDGFAGRLIWCRPDNRPSTHASVRWRRIVSTDTDHPDWTARSVTAADPDGTLHRCGLPQSCSIAVTAAEQSRAHHWRIREGKTTYEGHDLEPTHHMTSHYTTEATRCP